MGIHLDLYKGGTATGKLLIFNLLIPPSLLLGKLKVTCPVVHATENLICHVEGASVLDLGWLQFN
jgi:hypothetical protein